jgi:tripartite-type tricarboxylate transporter receptor subunit TctC
MPARRQFLQLALLCAATRAAWAQDYPARPIRAVIPFGPGSATDVIPRVVFEELAHRLGQSIVVDNRGGAGSTIGTGLVAKAAPDGLTLLATSSAYTITPALFPNLPYDPRQDLLPVGTMGSVPNVLVISPARGLKTLREFVAAAKAKPGSFTFASVGVGSAVHLSAERFRAVAGYEAVHIPFKGGAEALTEVMAGRVDYYFCPIATALPFIREGKLLALAASSPTRASALPNVPTTLESGYPDSDFTVWIGVFAPKGTPAAIVDKLNHEITAAAQAPATQARLASMGVEPMVLTPAAFAAQVRAEIDRYGPFVKAAGMKAD